MTRTARTLHPIAWWLWAIGLAAAVSHTTNPLLLFIVLAVLGYVVSARRTDAPWARAFKYYLGLAAITIAIRVLFRAVFTIGAGAGDHVLVRLPVIPMPHWYAGVQVGGAVSIEGVLSAGTDGLRLAVLLCCVGAANTLANPKRALRVLPGALYELGVAVTVALTVAPQLVESLLRVRRARRLRPSSRRRGPLRALRSLLIPVLQDALSRSLLLAAAMDSRGYGRHGSTPARTRHITAGLLITGMLGLCVGGYGLLDVSAPRLLGRTALLAGAAVCVAGLALGGRRVKRTSYRPDQWSWPEWTTAVAGAVPAVVLFTHSRGLTPGFSPLAWPPLPLTAAIAILVAALPAIVAPTVDIRGSWPGPLSEHRETARIHAGTAA